MAPGDMKERVDVGVITVRPDEFTAVLKRFGQEGRHEGLRSYVISRIATVTRDPYVVALVRCSRPGTLEAQSVARDMISDLDPQWLLLIGIAGGVPRDEFTLGDVVAATSVNDYSIEAVLPGGESQYAVAGAPMHRDVVNALAILKASEDKGLGDWNSESAIGMPRPGVTLRDPNLYDGDQEWNSRVEGSLSKHFGSIRRPLVTTGLIASSDRLVREPAIVREWLRTARNIYAIEMQLAGVCQAARDRKVLAIRGISDIVGFRRDEEWTGYACETAAAFAHAFVRAGIIDPSATSYGHRSEATYQSNSGLRSERNDGVAFTEPTMSDVSGILDSLKTKTGPESDSRLSVAIRLEIAAIISLAMGIWMASRLAPITANYDIVTLYALPSVATVGLISSILARYSLAFWTKGFPMSHCAGIVGIALLFLVFTWVLAHLLLLVS